jgi:hypothetical protein
MDWELSNALGDALDHEARREAQEALEAAIAASLADDGNEIIQDRQSRKPLSRRISRLPSMMSLLLSRPVPSTQFNAPSSSRMRQEPGIQPSHRRRSKDSGRQQNSERAGVMTVLRNTSAIQDSRGPAALAVSRDHNLGAAASSVIEVRRAAGQTCAAPGRPTNPADREVCMVSAEMDRLEELNEMPSHAWTGEAVDCAMCLEEIVRGATVRQLSCNHTFHAKCIDPWFWKAQAGQKRRCPICNANPLAKGDLNNPFRNLPAGAALPTNQDNDRRMAQVQAVQDHINAAMVEHATKRSCSSIASSSIQHTGDLKC